MVALTYLLKYQLPASWISAQQLALSTDSHLGGFHFNVVEILLEFPEDQYKHVSISCGGQANSESN